MSKISKGGALFVAALTGLVLAGTSTAWAKSVSTTLDFGGSSQEASQSAAGQSAGADDFTLEADCLACHTDKAPQSESEQVAQPGSAETAQTAHEETEVSENAAEADGELALQSADESCLADTHAASGCAACHNNETVLRAVHSNPTTEDATEARLNRSKVNSTVCIECHGSYDVLEVATEDSTALVDIAGTSVNPHAAATLTESHVEADMQCTDCHKVHDSTDVAEDAMAYCTKCHHANTFECGTCHD